MSGAPFRAGMVGAGNICQYHVAAVQALPDVELVGICDLDAARAEAAASEWGTRALPSLEALVEAGANVIHVLTPPSAHAAVAIEALERGCHVLVEKPIAERVEDARQIGEVAASKGLMATVDHALLYDPQVLRALSRVRAGALGKVVGVDIFRSSEYPPYEGGPLPPQYRDAGYPWRDLGVHCLYLIQELLGTIGDVDAEWSSLGGDPNLAFDEWRALVRCERGLGQFQLSWNSKPMQSQMVIHGTSGVLRVDLFAMFLGRRSVTPLPKAAERVVNAYAESLQPLVDVPRGAWKFVRGEVQAFQGLRDLVADFYRRLAEDAPPPVSIEDAAVIVEWTEKVARAAEADQAERLARFALSPSTEFLVTGASGSLGSAVVRRLLSEGRGVRAFVRRVPERPMEGVEYCFGNLGDPEAVERAVAGAARVIHCGAATSGGWPEQYGATVVGTRNVIESCRRHGVEQLVQISSMSVLDWASAAGGVLSEETPLEPRASERGAYTRSKLEAEVEVSAAAAEGLPCVMLRPGLIFGGGIGLLGGSVARRAGRRWLILGDGRLPLPLVYIEDVVDAVMACVERDLTGGEAIQLVDGERLTQEDVLSLAAGDDGAPLRLPRGVVFALGKLSEYPLGALGRESPVGLYRLRSALSRVEFESRRAEELLGWRPRVGVREGIRRVVEEARVDSGEARS